MKVFISWSGPETREFAAFLRDWLQGVIQAVKPWMSEKDIAKGRHSMAELRAQLADTRLGIVVLTAANQGSQWVNFEAGAISNSVGEAAVIPLLLDLGKTDVVGPLSQFQAVDAVDRAEVHQMLEAINRAQREPLPERVLAHASEREWPGFEAEVRRFRSATRALAEVVPSRDDREVLAEILETVRALDRESHATRSLVVGLSTTLNRKPDPAEPPYPPLPAPSSEAASPGTVSGYGSYGTSEPPSPTYGQSGYGQSGYGTGYGAMPSQSPYASDPPSSYGAAAPPQYGQPYGAPETQPSYGEPQAYGEPRSYGYGYGADEPEGKS